MSIPPLPDPTAPMSLIELMLLASAAPATMVQYHVMGDSDADNGTAAIDHAACAVLWVTEVRSKHVGVNAHCSDLRYIVADTRPYYTCSECARGPHDFQGAKLKSRR